MANEKSDYTVVLKRGSYIIATGNTNQKDLLKQTSEAENMKISWNFRRFLASTFAFQNSYVRESLAELFGTFILVILNLGAAAQFVLSNGKVGTPVTVQAGGALGVFVAIYVAGGISGAHINPAISLAMSVIGQLAWKKLPLYLLSQYIGAFGGAVFTYIMYQDALDIFDNGKRMVYGQNATAQIFGTMPRPGLSVENALYDQIGGTFLLAIGVLAIWDKKNLNAPPCLSAFLTGCLVLCIGLNYGYNCGFPLNPARDISPRLFTAFAGWGADVFWVQNGLYPLICIVGPHLGAILGALSYLFFIGNNFPPDSNHNSDPRSFEDEASQQLFKKPEREKDLQL